MDKKFVGVSTFDEVGPRGLVHPKARSRRLYVVPSPSINGDSYGDVCRSKSHEALYFASNSVPDFYDTLVEEGIEKRYHPHFHPTNRVICLA